jgi:hypothetical protein
MMMEMEAEYNQLIHHHLLEHPMGENPIFSIL